jgi:hypothetical protein
MLSVVTKLYMTYFRIQIFLKDLRLVDKGTIFLNLNSPSRKCEEFEGVQINLL